MQDVFSVTHVMRLRLPHCLDWFVVCVSTETGCFSLPPDALKYRGDSSCQASASLPAGSLQPVPTAVWGDWCQCLGHKPPCPHWSTRSHRRPLRIKGENSQICYRAVSFIIQLLTFFNAVLLNTIGQAVWVFN